MAGRRPGWVEPQCTGGPCISEQQAHPGEDLRDSAAWQCDTCGANVCGSCGRRPVEMEMSLCGPCGIADLATVPEDPALADERDLRAELHRMAGRIVHASGLDYRTVQTRLNQSMGVWRRDQADDQQLQRGLEVAERWLAECAASSTPSAEQTAEQTAERNRLLAELEGWAARNGMTLAQVAELATAASKAAAGERAG